MFNVRHILCAGLIFSLLGISLSHAQADDWKDALKNQLKAAYTLTVIERNWVKGILLDAEKMNLDAARINPGTVLVIQKEGIKANWASESVFFNKVRDGKIGTQGGILGAMQTYGSKENTMRTFKPGERMYVTKIGVKDKEVFFDLLSRDMFDINIDGTTSQKRYCARLNFEFPKNYLETADSTKVKETIDVVLKKDEGTKADTTGPKTVELGQTPEQVEAILGKPEKIVKLDPKMIYIYKDMKIIFVDGKVADVQ